MHHELILHCPDTPAHVLHIDDAVILNWMTAMWQDACPAMLMALPQIQAAILEWRANWLGPKLTFTQLEDNFQGIHDHWLQRFIDPDTTPPTPRLPGDWEARFPIPPTANINWLEFQ